MDILPSLSFSLACIASRTLLLMSAPGTPGKQAAKGHHFFSASPSSALPSTTSASTSSTVASSSHYQVHRSANRPPTPKSSFRSTPVYSQLQNLHYDYVSSSSVSSASSFVDVDDGDGDISLAGPRPRLDRVLSSSQGTQSPSSLSQSGNQQRVLSLAVPTRPGQTSSAPSSPLAKRAPEPSRLASSLGRSASSSLGPAAGEQVISLDSLVAGNRAGGVPQTPPRLPGSKASDTPPSLSSQHRLDRLASRSLSVSIPNPRRYYLDVPERDGHQDLADDELSATAVRAPPLVDEKTARRMDRWVKEIVVCNFDLERGPVVERRAVGRRWGPGLKANV